MSSETIGAEQVVTCLKQAAKVLSESQRETSKTGARVSVYYMKGYRGEGMQYVTATFAAYPPHDRLVFIGNKWYLNDAPVD